ncbi:hypothetical protein JR316_0011648 [Psilocybe cubensis]|uniref:Uncharacterized protein n=1 Tax=Psilocybe cubensis TaxID=181762 RepID=A0ACB8GKC5_PSICU|nr:hypothetical protein JR316_0011648 [Psilocybe cubensis]KAH9476078.1 hypothetical protein JR316_0011648 [Psilocybe cubensis]
MADTKHQQERVKILVKDTLSVKLPYSSQKKNVEKICAEVLRDQRWSELLQNYENNWPLYSAVKVALKSERDKADKALA